MTRLLRIMAPLYDGPQPEIAREFRRNRRARFCVAIWLCGPLRRRLGWPPSFVDRPLRWLQQIASAADAFLPLDNLVFGLWEICPELQASCDLHPHEGRAALLAWFVETGIKQFELDDCISKSLRDCLPRVRGCQPQQTPTPARKRGMTLSICACSAMLIWFPAGPKICI